MISLILLLFQEAARLQRETMPPSSAVPPPHLLQHRDHSHSPSPPPPQAMQAAAAAAGSVSSLASAGSANAALLQPALILVGNTHITVRDATHAVLGPKLIFAKRDKQDPSKSGKSRNKLQRITYKN